MPVGVCVPTEGVDVLEKGLKSLRRSRMMTVHEFKDMFGAIDRHYRDLKFAHLTGKSKDLLDQAVRDTKFYNILVNMLCEVKDVKSGRQQESLRKVYTWYLANKHVLYTGPHFGKSYRRQEAQEVLRKALTPRDPPPSREKTRSARLSRKQSSLTSNGHQSADNKTPSKKSTPAAADGDFSDSEVDIQVALNDEDGLDESIIRELQSGYDTLGNVTYRCETPRVRITPLKEQCMNTPHSHSPHGLPRRMVHSVASMVNPHASHTLTLSPQEQQGHLAHRPTTAPVMREDILQSWRNFNMDVAYGQNVISKLNFVGRSGTMCDVRYTAHEHGEMPELNTRHFLQGIPVKPPPAPTQNNLLKKTLEEFYTATDAYYPSSLPKQRSASARHKSRSSPLQQKPSATAPLGRDLVQPDRPDSVTAGDTNVRLDTVVDLIDTVTDNMTVHREVVAPRPSPGFRQPSATGIPSTPVVSRPTTSRSGRSMSRRQSPTARTNTPASSPSRSQLVNSPTDDILMDDPEVAERSRSALPPRSASAIDWRGKITPNSNRYKWGKTKFGGHTYIKNLNRPKSMRSAGSTSAGSRPKTAPVSARKKWNTEKQSDTNSRIAQAASHTTVEVDQQDVDSLMVIQHLLGTSDSRRDSFGSLFGYDDEFFKNIRNCSPGSMASNAQALEYLSFVTSSQGLGGRRSAPEEHGRGHSSVNDAHPDGILLSDPLYLPDHFPVHTNVSVSSGADIDQADLDTELDDLCEEENQTGETTQQEKTTQQGNKAKGDWANDAVTVVSASNPLGEPHIPTAEPEEEPDLQEESQAEFTQGDNDLDQSIKEDNQDLKKDLHHSDLVNQGDLHAYKDPSEESLQKELGQEEGEEKREEGEESGLEARKELGEGRGESGEEDKESRAEELRSSPDGGEKDVADKEVQVAVTSVPAAGQGPLPPQQRQVPLQTLSKSHTWSYIPGLEEEEKENQSDAIGNHNTIGDLRLKTASTRYRVTSEHFTGASFSQIEQDTGLDMSTRVERSAGRMPTQTISGHPIRTSRRANEVFSRPPPMRTPPSIPTQYNPYGGRSPRGSQIFNKELETHARKARSPRHYMERVRDLRQTAPPRSAPPVLTNSADSELLNTLHVCRLPTREKTVIITTDPELEGPPSILKGPDSWDGLSREVSDYDKQVKFGSANEILESEVDAQSEPRMRTASRTDSGLSSKQESFPSTPQTKQSLARVGRPIAHYQSVTDPEELSRAVQLQKEAAAAVDIQRIFRGYVARGAYKRLLSEERHRLEDEQRAKLNSRRMHREHVERTQAIYKRGPNEENINWQRDYQSIKDQRERERQEKMDSIARENAVNHHVSNSKISVIGPHVEIYQVYHPKKTGPSQREFNRCALKIQKHIRGWLVRRRLDKLKRKAAWSGNSFEKMVKEYKQMLARVQRQHGRDRPKTPFTFHEMNEYMDLRRRYESVFEKKAFGGELEMEELDQLFKECDLYPSQAELDEAIDVTFRGRGLKGRGLKKREVLDIVFYVYVPSAAGLENTRMSTWMSPIIDGVEARRLIGSEAVEPAPLDVCAKLVIASKRERREKENQRLRELRGETGEDSGEEDEAEHRRKQRAKLKNVTINKK